MHPLFAHWKSESENLPELVPELAQNARTARTFARPASKCEGKNLPEHAPELAQNVSTARALEERKREPAGTCARTCQECTHRSRICAARSKCEGRNLPEHAPELAQNARTAQRSPSFVISCACESLWGNVICLFEDIVCLFQRRSVSASNSRILSSSLSSKDKVCLWQKPQIRTRICDLSFRGLRGLKILKAEIPGLRAPGRLSEF